MERLRVICFHIRSFECGSPCLCWLRTASIGPWGTSVNYVLAHMGFMRSQKLISFVGHRDGSYPTIPSGCHWDSLWATHGCPSRYRVKLCTRVRWARIVSLIASRTVPTCGVFVTDVCRIVRSPLCKVVNWFESLLHSRKWVMVWSMCSNILIQLHYVMLIMRMMLTTL
jgi:hypothetical protein